jgi:hypothetical protein
VTRCEAIVVEVTSPETSDRPVGLAEIARVFFKIGAMSYGGPAIMGIMQTEIQERRQWISKGEFVEGLALVNMLPGPLVTQLGIFIGHAGLIWLNRPEVRNAFNETMIAELTAAFTALEMSAEVRVVVLAGDGRALPPSPWRPCDFPRR